MLQLRKNGDNYQKGKIEELLKFVLKYLLSVIYN
jgi:hypothetical protein